MQALDHATAYLMTTGINIALAKTVTVNITLFYFLHGRTN
jgi:hypothetical protein